MAKLKVIKGNIIHQHTTAIVNAANSRLAGGGGIDAVIHKAAGLQQLNKACSKLGGCHSGDAKVTSGFNLPSKYIIHTVGPIWTGGNHNEPQTLASCYNSCLREAEKYHCKSVAFCSISTGAYHFPIKLAAKIAVKTIEKYKTPIRCVMVCYSNHDYHVYETALDKYLNHK